jgi:hypothetical protein
MPKKVTIYHKETGAAELYTIDAREALNAHPDEWSAKPWTASKKASKKESALQAKHAGGGSWFIFDGDEKIGDAISKEDAEAFNALSDEEKAAFVKKD